MDSKKLTIIYIPPFIILNSELEQLKIYAFKKISQKNNDENAVIVQSLEGIPNLKQEFNLVFYQHD